LEQVNLAERADINYLAEMMRRRKRFGDGAELEQRCEDVGDGAEDGSGEVSVPIRACQG
jgi:hypothetical protein